MTSTARLTELLEQHHRVAVLATTAWTRIRAGHPDWRPMWALVEASRRDDPEGYAIAILQAHRWTSEHSLYPHPGTLHSAFSSLAQIARWIDGLAELDVAFTAPAWLDEAPVRRG